MTSAQPQQGETSPSAEPKSKVTLEERISRGEAQTGPTVPLVQVPPKDYEPSPNVRQVYPPLSEAQQQEQQKQAQLQANQAAQPTSPPAATTEEDKTTKEETTTSSTTEEVTLASAPAPTAEQEKPKTEEATATSASAPQKSETQPTQEITPAEEKKIVDSVLKQLTPFVEQLVAAEVQRVLSGQPDFDANNGFGNFPLLFGGGPIFASSHGGPPPQGFQQQQQVNRVRMRKKILNLFIFLGRELRWNSRWSFIHSSRTTHVSDERFCTRRCCR